MTKRKKPNAQQMVASINKRDIHLLRELVAKATDPNMTENFSHSGNVTMLNYAAGCQFTEGVQLLLDAGADSNIPETAGLGGDGVGGTALHSAIYGEDTRPGSEIKRSTDEDRYQIVDLLLKAGADPNAVRNGTELPLTKSAGKGQLKISERLIEAGATFKTWPLGCSPPLLGPAAGASPFNPPEELKLERVAKLLLDLGAPVDGEGPQGSTALTVAAFGLSERLVNLLLEHRAAANHQDKCGRTPLIRVAEAIQRTTVLEKHRFAVQLAKRLLQAGADPGIRNNKGETACDIASRNQLSSIVADYLKTVGNHSL